VGSKSDVSIVYVYIV